MTREQEAEALGVAVEELHWCEICECWTIYGEDGYPFCACA